jgi:hypothetical protein
VKDLQRIEDFGEEYTNGEIQDRPYFRPSFFTFRESQRAPDSALPRVCCNDYGGTLGALTLNPSGFCNIGDH